MKQIVPAIGMAKKIICLIHKVCLFWLVFFGQSVHGLLKWVKGKRERERDGGGGGGEISADPDFHEGEGAVGGGEGGGKLGCTQEKLQSGVTFDASRAHIASCHMCA